MLKRKRNVGDDIALNSQPALSSKKTVPKILNLFEETLRKAGFFIGQINNSNELDVDQAVFVRDLTKLLKEKDITAFIDGLENILEDEVRFKWSLLPTATASTCKTARNACQDSLIHLLLGIEVLQVKITKILLDKLVEFSVCSAVNGIFDPSEGKSVACMILSQFRWLNKLTDSKELSLQLLELVKATPTEVQQDIITLLPDILSEYDHSNVARSLGDILLSSPELNVTILNTLSNLNIDSETMTNVRTQVLKTLSSANADDLPTVVRFVLLNLSSEEVADTINELRNNLDFTPPFDPVYASTPIQQKSQSSAVKGVGCHILSAIKLSLKFQKTLCDAWLKVLDLVKCPENHKSLDFMVLLLLHSLGVYQKKVESIIRNKIKYGDINENLLNATFRCHHEILKEYLTTLLNISEVLLRSTEPVVSLYGCSLYVKSFVWFDTFNKQEIVGNLITHIGNGSVNEINAALDTLISLIKHHAQKMVPFGIFIKNLLDHFDDLSLSQIRKVHSMLSMLSYHGGREGVMLQDDMFIIIRKQLMNGNLRYRKMGVIGALMAAKAVSHKGIESMSPDITHIENSEKTHQKAIVLLELARKSTVTSPEAFALFYDELSRIIVEGQFEKEVNEWIDEHLLADFEQKYIIDAGSNVISALENGSALRFGLDEINDPVALNLYGIVKLNMAHSSSKPTVSGDNMDWSDEEDTSSMKQDPNNVINLLLKLPQSSAINQASTSTPKAAYPLILASSFRLLRIRKQSQDGSLDEIDALLGCPILLPELKHPKFSLLPMKEKQLVLDIIFFSVNWIRETINAFSPVDDKEIKLNICYRLQLLVDLQELLCKYIHDAANYLPPMANFACEENELPRLKLVSQKSTKKKSSKKQIKKKKTHSSEDNTSKITQRSQSKAIDDDSDDDDGNVFANNEITIASTMTALQPYFREFDIDIFVLFKLGVTFKKPSDAFSEKKERELALHPREIKFLLDDLTSKLRHYLLSSNVHFPFKSVQRHIGFSNLELHSTDEVAEFCIRLLPAFCDMLDDFHTYFGNIIAESDDIVDNLILIGEDSQLISHCMQLTFKVVHCILSWKGFILSDNLAVLKKAMHVLASKVKNLPDHASLQDLINLAIQYFSKFSKSVISLSCATALVQVMETILIHSKHNEPKTQIVEISEHFLKRHWIKNKTQKIADTNVNIQSLLEAYLQHSESILQSLEHLATEAISQLLNTDEEDSTETSFNTLSKTSLSCYYKIMMRNLADYMKLYYAQKPEEENDELIQWSLAIKVFHILINLIKTFDGRSMIQASLKYGRQFVDTFLKHGMPLLDKRFSSNRDDVLFLLKNLQMGTRYMQHICSHSKVLKDVSLTKEVPFLRKTLESFVYRVKVMLAVNKCEEAFWLGNLKNRDLKGSEILSQALKNSESDSGSDNESIKSLSDKSDHSDRSEELL